MDKRQFRNLLAALMVTGNVCASSAMAGTVTFDALPDEGTAFLAGNSSPYIENGVTVSATTPGSVLAYNQTPGAAHIDDSGTAFTSGLKFTMGTLFDALNFTVISLGYNFFETPGPLDDNIRVSGLNGGKTVATKLFTLSDTFLDTQTFKLGKAFNALDALLIEIVYPMNTALCDAPCAHFNLDQVELEGYGEPLTPLPGPAPVPLPASAALLGVAGLALYALRRRRTA